MVVFCWYGQYFCFRWELFGRYICMCLMRCCTQSHYAHDNCLANRKRNSTNATIRSKSNSKLVFSLIAQYPMKSSPVSTLLRYFTTNPNSVIVKTMAIPSQLTWLNSEQPINMTEFDDSKSSWSCCENLSGQHEAQTTVHPSLTFFKFAHGSSRSQSRLGCSAAP